MINPSVSTIQSVINGFTDAKDSQRAFTYTEFVKEWGFGDEVDDFIVNYQDYLIKWNETQNFDNRITNEQFVEERLIDILKGITIDYASYEEQDFIANLDWTNHEHIRNVIPLYCRKIREITEFYRKKRNEAHLIVRRNSFNGSTMSIEEIIYTKVFDYIFLNRDNTKQYVDIKRDLKISIETFVDTYSEYFDIPRTKEIGPSTRRDILTANMNDVDYKNYLQISKVVSELLYSGKTFLKQIPLIASLALDLSQKCVGDMLQLKNTMLENVTINQIPLDEQIALKRRLYEKFLGTDLYYLYTDSNKNIVKQDILCKAKNPTGNLLNCGNADVAVTQSSSEYLKLLSHIGLFFKPDKTSILNVNSKSFTYDIDKDALTADTLYVFANPEKYGDIGNNKSKNYPFVMRHKLDFDIKNMSSGVAKDDPLIYITDQSWRGYYSKQDEDFRIIKNYDYEYSFTSLANNGFLYNYQIDSYGNQFALLKGREIKYFNADGEEVDAYDPEGTVEYIFAKDTIDVPRNETLVEESSRPILFNGGYFEDPYHEGQAFNFDRKRRIDDNYNWSGITMMKKPLVVSSLSNRGIRFGSFGDTEGVEYTDHFKYTNDYAKDVLDNEDISLAQLKTFLSHRIDNDENAKVKINVKEMSSKTLQNAAGELYVKTTEKLSKAPIKLCDASVGVLSFQIAKNNIVLEKEDSYVIYSYDNVSIQNGVIEKVATIEKKDYNASCYNEKESCSYFASLRRETNPEDENFYLTITKYNCLTKETSEVVKDFSKSDHFYVSFVRNTFLDTGVSFAYNSSLDTYLISCCLNDDCGIPYIYAHSFKMKDIESSIETNIYTPYPPDKIVRIYIQTV